jgi:hypothetical protein
VHHIRRIVTVRKADTFLIVIAARHGKTIPDPEPRQPFAEDALSCFWE